MEKNLYNFENPHASALCYNTVVKFDCLMEIKINGYNKEQNV